MTCVQNPDHSNNAYYKRFAIVLTTIHNSHLIDQINVLDNILSQSVQLLNTYFTDTSQPNSSNFQNCANNVKTLKITSNNINNVFNGSESGCYLSEYLYHVLIDQIFHHSNWKRAFPILTNIPFIIQKLTL